MVWEPYALETLPYSELKSRSVEVLAIRTRVPSLDTITRCGLRVVAAGRELVRCMLGSNRTAKRPVDMQFTCRL